MDKKHNILVVDDDNFMLQFVRALIDKEKYEVIICREPLKAIQIVEEGTIDIVISDIEMPGITGIELVNMIKAINSKIPVIFISSLDKPDLEKELIGVGGFGFVRKPVGPLDLENMIHKACKTIDQAA